MIRSVLASFWILALLGATAAAGECRNPDALGIERTLVVDPAEHARIGTMQYPETLPLNDKEVVLTFDDGPLPPYTNRVLQALAAECVKATFFLVGRQSRAYPEMVRRIYNEGHTVASHSQNHPLIFTRLPHAAAELEIEQGIEAATAALGDRRALAPFFRFPGLGRSQSIEAYLASRGIMVWSADFPADDWKRVSPKAVMARALERLERKGKGVLLLHDIQPRTVLILPELLRELKARGFKIVHIEPATPDRPKTLTEPLSWVFHRPMRQGWPRIVEQDYELPAPSVESFGWPNPFRIRDAVAMPQVVTKPLRAASGPPAWSPTPHVSLVETLDPSPLTPAPQATFSDPAVEPAAVAPLAEPVTGVVASPDLFSQMSTPAAWIPRPKAKPTRKARAHGPMPSGRSSAIRHPLPLAPKLVARPTTQTAR
jgi:peptidoglycan/xylan/chitin deacetylase (PgdA/CDA1 family)